MDLKAREGQKTPDVQTARYIGDKLMIMIDVKLWWKY